MTVHPIDPIYDEQSRILILGSFPSVKSREDRFYYANERNRFWRVLSAVFDKDLPNTKEDKIAFLHDHHIALWDVIASCDLDGSADASIKNVTVNDVGRILKDSKVEIIVLNGKTAQNNYQRYLQSILDTQTVCLPSTSPANAAWSEQRLIDEWKILLHYRGQC